MGDVGTANKRRQWPRRRRFAASIATLLVISGVAEAQPESASADEHRDEHGARSDARSGYVIYNTLTFEADREFYTGTNGNAWSGLGAFDHIFDLQIADDFETTGLSLLTSVTGGYETLLGREPAGGLQVDVWTATASGPGVLVASQTAPVDAVSTWSHTGFGNVGIRLSASVNIPLEPNTRYFIMIQPIDLTEDGDWYYQIRQTFYSHEEDDSHARDGGRANGGYGVGEWTSMFDLGYDPGDTGMEIRGVNPDCIPDCNGDGSADTSDLTCFLYRWNERDPGTDCNADGVINTIDVVCYLTAWSRGCD